MQLRKIEHCLFASIFAYLESPKLRANSQVTTPRACAQQITIQPRIKRADLGLRSLAQLKAFAP